MDRLVAENTVNFAGADFPPPTGTPGYATDGNPGLGVPATRWPASAFNALQEELMNVILDAGITPSRSNLTQLLQAINMKGRRRFTADRTFYVATTGDDATGDGSVGFPWQTIQKAWNTIGQDYDLAGYNANIQLGDGTYTAGLSAFQGRVGQYQGNKITLQGNAGNPLAVIINAAAGDAVLVKDGARIAIKNFRMLAPAGHCLDVIGAQVEMGEGISFGAAAGAHILAQNSGAVAYSQNYSVVGGAALHIQTYGGGLVVAIGSRVVSITGTPDFATAFAGASSSGIIDITGTTYSGGTTGKRYSATLNGVINTGGGGPNYFPGSVAGTITTGGQYA